MGGELRKAAPAGLAILAAVLLGCSSGSPTGGAAAPAEPETGGGEGGAGDAAEAGEAEQIAAIERAVNEFSTAVHTCWAIGAADDFHLEGKVVLALTIGAGGGSEDVEVVTDEPKDERLTACLVELWGDYVWPDVFRAGDKIQLPPLDFVAPDAQYSVSVAHVEARSLSEGKLEASIVLDEDNTGNDAAAITILRARDQLEVPLHRHGAAELLYVFAGEGETWGARGQRRAQKVGPGTGVYIPAGAPHAFRHVGEEPLVALQLYAPAGPEQRFDGKGSAGTEPVDPKALRGRRGRLPRPKVRATAEARSYPIADGKGKASILFDAASTGDDAAYLGAITLEPGASVPRHRHEASSEYVFLIEGIGEMYVGGRAFTVQGGDAVQVPPGVEHGFVVTGEEAVKAVQFYAPAGPEQRFKRASE